MKKHASGDSGKTVSSTLPDYNISFISDMNAVVDDFHPCYKVIVSLDNPFTCVIEGEIHKGLQAVILNHDIVHSIFSSGTNLLVYLIKKDSFYGEQLNSWLAGGAWQNITDLLNHKQGQWKLPADYAILPNETLIPYMNALLDSIFPYSITSRKPVTDERVWLILNYIEENIHEPLELEDVARVVNLSSERIRHLFTEKMYIPFTQYVLWYRVVRTMAVAIHENRRLSTACIQCGFADQPHFNRAFKRIFGVSPANLLRENRVLL